MVAFIRGAHPLTLDFQSHLAQTRGWDRRAHLTLPICI